MKGMFLSQATNGGARIFFLRQGRGQKNSDDRRRGPPKLGTTGEGYLRKFSKPRYQMMIMIVGVKRTFQECFTYLSTDYLLFIYSDNY